MLFSQVLSNFYDIFYKEQDRHVLWLPVFLGLGIGLGFYLSPAHHLFFVLLGLLATLFIYRFNFHMGFGLLIVILGITLVWWHHAIRQDVILLKSPRTLGKFEGTVLSQTETSFGQKLRLHHIQPEKPFIIPLRAIDLTLRGCPGTSFTPGDTIEGEAKLMPSREKLTPDGFDFRRKAFFEGVTAEGYFFRCPTVLHKKEAPFLQMRHALTHFILKNAPAPMNGLITALTTGETKMIPGDLRNAFVNAGLAHLLAISGLHMNLIAGAVFALFIFLFNLFPGVRYVLLRRKIAAFLTIGAALLYLLLAGASVSSQRAFIMLSLVMIALIVERHPLSMRLVAIAAFIILCVNPHYLFTPSFQMSFGAVIALIGSYEHRPNFLYRLDNSTPFGRFLHYLLAILYSSFVATLATIPFTLYHFHTLSLVGIVANLAAIPLTAFFIMPLVLLLLILFPYGYGFLPLSGLTKTVGLLHDMALFFGELPLGRLWLPHLSSTGLFLIVIGALWFFIWRTKWRYGGWLFIVGGGAFFFFQEMPTVLVSKGAKNIAFVEQEKLCISSSRKDALQYKAWADYLGIKHDRILYWCHCEKASCSKEGVLLKLDSVDLFLKKPPRKDWQGKKACQKENAQHIEETLAPYLLERDPSAGAFYRVP